MKIFVSGLVLFLSACSATSSPGEKPEKELRGSYLGQNPPGMAPQIFAPGVLTSDKVGAFCSVFSPEGDEIYYTRYLKDEESSGDIARMRQMDGIWIGPELLPVNSDTIENDMCLSADGRTLIFRSWRALPDGSRPDNHSWLWHARKTGEAWGKAEPLLCGGVPVRTGYPSISSDGTLYFTFRSGGRKGIYRASLVDGVYAMPEHVYTVLDTVETEGDMFVAPDESYMIISCWDHPGNIGGGQGDLYIVFRRDDGSWSEAVNMGPEINTRAGENCPTVSPDGDYLFFNRYDRDTDIGNTYWVDARIISSFRQPSVPETSHPYLGQKPPGTTAELFAPGIVSTAGQEALCGFFNEGTMLIFDRWGEDSPSNWTQNPVFTMVLKNGKWTGPSQSTNIGKPWFHNFPDAPAGLKIYFAWKGKLDGSGPENELDIWRVKKNEYGWARPEKLPPPVNTSSKDTWPSVAEEGTLYFFSDRPGGYGRGDLYRSRLAEGQHPSVENLGAFVNTEYTEHDPFIAPDQSYLVFSSFKPDGMGTDDLYVSFQRVDGGWTHPRNLGEGVNSPASDNRPYITPDGKYLFFTSNRDGGRGEGDIYWVDARIIEEFRSRILKQ